MAARSTDPRATAKKLLTALDEANRRPEARSAYSAALDNAMADPRHTRDTLDCLTRVARVALMRVVAGSEVSGAEALDEAIGQVGTLNEPWPPPDEPE